MSLNTLSLEILLEMTEYLETTELFRLRLLSRKLYHICTPMAFRNIRIEMDLQSLERLHRIASDEALRLHVKILTLCRQTGLREFSGFEKWQECLRFASKEASVEWYSLSPETRMQRYHEYENDVAQSLNIRAYLTFRDCHTVRPSKSPDTAASSLNSKLVTALRSFDLDIAKLTHLETFIHEPGYWDDDHWGTHWGDLELDIDKMISCTDGGLDKDVDTLQLSYVLRALGWAKGDLPCLRSISFSVEGPGFWSFNRTCRLWNNQEMPPYLTWDSSSNISEEEPLTDDHDPDLYLRQLYLMEHACTRLRSFDLSISRDTWSQESIVEPLLKFFRRFEKLEYLRLTFGDIAFGELSSGHDIFGRDQIASSRLFKGLIEISYWDELRDLELELVTEGNALVRFISQFAKTLRRLTFTRVKLIDERWESVLSRLASTLIRLDILKTSMIEDYNPKLRVILSSSDTLENRRASWSLEDALTISLDTTALFQKYRQESRQGQLSTFYDDEQGLPITITKT